MTQKPYAQSFGPEEERDRDPELAKEFDKSLGLSEIKDLPTIVALLGNMALMNVQKERNL